MQHLRNMACACVSEGSQNVSAPKRTSNENDFSVRSFAVLKQLFVGKRTHGSCTKRRRVGSVSHVEVSQEAFERRLLSLRRIRPEGFAEFWRSGS